MLSCMILSNHLCLTVRLKVSHDSWDIKWWDMVVTNGTVIPYAIQCLLKVRVKNTDG